MKTNMISERRKRYIINNIVALKTYCGFPINRICDHINYNEEELAYVRDIWNLIPDYQTILLRKDLDVVFEKCLNVK